MAYIFFLVISLFFAIFNIFSTHDLSSISQWASEASYIDLRARIFSQLSFFEFVNLYTILPVVCFVCLGLVAEQCEVKKALIWIICTTSVIVLGFLLSFLFQRKVLIMLIIIGIGFLGSKQILGPGFRRARWIIPVVGGVIFAIIITPFLGHGAYAHIDHVLTMGANKILGRSSVPSMVYVSLFSEVLPYYAFDWGGSLLNIAEMPDDNIKVYQEMYGEGAYGTVMAPCYVVWYSQGGVWVAVIASFCLGVGLATIRLVGLWLGWHSHWLERAVNGIILYYLVTLVIDSWHNATLSSYGVIWPLILLVFIGLYREIPSRLFGARMVDE